MVTPTKVLRYLFDKDYRFNVGAARGFYKSISDKEYLEKLFKLRLGYDPDLSNPRTFNEKMQWLKLYDRKPLYSTLVDKYSMKAWVGAHIGEQYVIPTYAKWDNVEEIDVSLLPEQFVLKTNHDCGGIVICHNKTEFDLSSAKKRLRKHIKRNYYWNCREWPYKNVKPCVFAEQYLEGIEWEFQTWNFNGAPKLIAAIHEPHGINEKKFYDTEWVEVPFVSSQPKLKHGVSKPDELAAILSASKIAAQPTVFTRVDFIKTVDGQLRLGEITLFPAGGFVKWDPRCWDDEIGSWLSMP